MNIPSKSLCVIATLAIIYPAIYGFMSYMGRYVPVFGGTYGPADYSWAPRGFTSNTGWNYRVLGFFRPLYILDNKYWHTASAMELRQYPIDRNWPQEQHTEQWVPGYPPQGVGSPDP